MPLQMTAQSGKTSFRQLLSNRTSRVQASFVYSPGHPGSGQGVQFTDTSRNTVTSWLWNFGDGTVDTAQNPIHPFAKPGFYKVILTVGNSAGSGKASRTVSIMLSASSAGSSTTAAASFTHSPASPKTGQAIQFTDTSTNSPTSWLWHFGDGMTSNVENPTHIYGTASTYTVTLDASSGSGTKTASQSVTVIPASTLSAFFTFSPASPAVGQTVQFTDASTGSPTSWQWNFGDGSTSTAQNPTHTFTAAASYTVTLTATNSTGSQSVNQTVAVVPALTASFTFTPASPAAGQAVQFTDSSTGSPTSWQWSFGDGSTSTVQNPSHTFATAASYTVTLTASNTSGSKNVSRTVTVVAGLAASFTYSPASPAAGQAVQFTDTSTGSPTSCQWNFGDGSTSTAQNPSHSFTAAASYTVTLTASNTSGSKNVSRTVTVVAGLAASFTYSPASPAAGQAVQFTDTSTGSPTSWLWNFGDGSTSTAQNPSHTFATAASYGMNLTVTNASGSKNVSQTVTVIPGLAVSFTYSPASPVAGQAMQFTDTSTGSPTAWQWNFGDGSTSTVKNPSHTYSAVASYTVTLTVSSSSGSKSASQTVNVLPSSSLIASFSYSPASPAAGRPVQFTDTSTGMPTSWQWDFGDGISSTAQNPSHAYLAAGSYSVTLTIRTGSSLNSTSHTISVRAANVITAASPSLADVRVAIASANPGDTVMVPAGAATWSGGAPFVNWTADLVLTRGINLIGAGIDQTTITFSSPFGIGYQPSNAAFTTDDSLRISGFTFKHSGSASWGAGYANICLYGLYYTRGLAKNRIDHIKINDTSAACLWVTGQMWGVADNCQFEYTNNPYCTVLIIIRGTGGDRNTWDNFPASFGTANNFYIEDCTSRGPIWFEGGQGGRYCVRHNTFDATTEYDIFDMHGNQPAGGIGDNYATMVAEVYDNTFTNMVRAHRLCAIRGGKVLVYNNALSGSGLVGSSFLNSYEEYSDYRSPVNDPTTSIQHPNDSYLFNNTKNGIKFTELNISGTVDYNSTADAPYTPDPPYRVVPQKDKDIWWEQSSFSGVSGVGVGPLATRPPSCTTEGVGWWATDQSILYRWHNGVWGAFYTPYTYPHPLRSDPNIGN